VNSNDLVAFESLVNQETTKLAAIKSGASKKRQTRSLLFTSQILALVSVLLLALWNIIYFVALYKKDLYYSGMGEISKNVYTTQSKKVFLFVMIAESVVMVIFFCYSIWVSSTYRELMHGKGAFNDEESNKEDKEK
jgi:hypothetical protein